MYNKIDYSDVELVERLLTGEGVRIENTVGYGRLDEDVREALKELLYFTEEAMELEEDRKNGRGVCDCDCDCN